MKNALEQYFHEAEHRLMLKWQHYFEIYERHFAAFRGRPVTVLEIGVFQGGSLQMWSDYFGSEARIFGLDTDPRCAEFCGERVQVWIGDQSDRALLERLSAAAGGFEIVIDDGGHRMEQQVTSFEVLYPRLRDGGVYVCEDLHTSYWREFGGGYRQHNSFIEFGKRLIDELHAWHSRDEHSLPVTELTRTTSALHFYDSVLVVEKRYREPPQQVGKGTPVWS